MKNFNRLPRKLKKELKSKYKYRYGVSWLKCCNVITEYCWFYKNKLNFNMSNAIHNYK